MASSKRTSKRAAAKIARSGKAKTSASIQATIKKKTTNFKKTTVEDEESSYGEKGHKTRQQRPQHGQQPNIHGLYFPKHGQHNRNMLKDFTFESIPTFDDKEKSPVDYTYSNKHAFYYDEENHSLTLFERTGIEATPEEMKEAGPNIESLEVLPSQPRWFPEHIKEIFDSPRYPGNVSFTVSIMRNVRHILLIIDRHSFN
jgi:hypothetical protein